MIHLNPATLPATLEESAMKHRIDPAAAAFILGAQVFATASTGSVIAGVIVAAALVVFLGRTFWSVR